MAAKKKKTARKELRTPPSNVKQREGRGYSKAQLNRKSKLDGMSTMEWIKKNTEKVGSPENLKAKIRKANAAFDSATQQKKKASKKKPARRKYK
jgi:hypothetical protein